MLLCTWISNCPIAVTHFLHNQENVPFVSFCPFYYFIGFLMPRKQVVHYAVFFSFIQFDFVLRLKPLIQSYWKFSALLG